MRIYPTDVKRVRLSFLQRRGAGIHECAVVQSAGMLAAPLCNRGKWVIAVYALCTFPSIGHSQQTQSVLGPTQTLHSQLLACQRRFRLAEMSAHTPHQPQAMAEFCMDVDLSCKGTGERSVDCVKAVAALDRLLASAARSMSANSTPRIQ
jgi:hypothetical protein